MNFNNTWRNYVNQRPKSKGLLLGEQIIRERRLIAEGKKDDAKKANPITDSFEVVDVLAIQLRAEFGDKGMAKYIGYATREMEEFYRQNTRKDGNRYILNPDVLATRHFEEVMGSVLGFHRNLQRLELKDINKYTLQSLTRVIEELGQSETARKKAFYDEKEAKRNSELVFNSNGIHAVRPLTTQASCFFGHNPRLTTWCISTKSKRNYFKQYTEEEGKAFVMVRFFGVEEGTDNHMCSMQFSGPGEPEFEMWWDGPRNRAQNPDDFFSVFLEHVEGMFPDDEENWSDLAQELHDSLVAAATGVVWDDPPADPVDAITPKCEAIEAAFKEKSEFTTIWWTTDQDTFEEHGYVAVDFGANTEFKLTPEDHGIPAEVIGKTDEYNFWRGLESRWEKACKDAGLYAYEKYDLYTTAAAASLPEGTVVLGLQHEGDETVGGYTLEGFEEFADAALNLDKTDAIESMKMAIAILQQEFGEQETGLPAEDEQGFDDEIDENTFYKDLEKQLLGEEKGRTRQRGIYKFHCMISYSLTAEPEKARGLDDILADMRALQNVTIVTVAIRNQKIGEGRYIAGLAIKFIPSIPGEIGQPEMTKARIVRDIKRLANIKSLFKLSAGLTRLE
tara:strand:- start:1903 stop:3759 length:1857 start_codon:yes stop_codon:yes gene_type:complete